MKSWKLLLKLVEFNGRNLISSIALTSKCNNVSMSITTGKKSGLCVKFQLWPSSARTIIPIQNTIQLIVSVFSWPVDSFCLLTLWPRSFHEWAQKPEKDTSMDPNQIARQIRNDDFLFYNTLRSQNKQQDDHNWTHYRAAKPGICK